MTAMYSEQMSSTNECLHSSFEFSISGLSDQSPHRRDIVNPTDSPVVLVVSVCNTGKCGKIKNAAWGRKCKTETAAPSRKDENARQTGMKSRKNGCHTYTSFTELYIIFSCLCHLNCWISIKKIMS